MPVQDSPNVALHKSLRTILATAQEGQISSELQNYLVSEAAAMWLDLALRERLDRFWGMKGAQKLKVGKSLGIIPAGER